MRSIDKFCCDAQDEFQLIHIKPNFAGLDVIVALAQRNKGSTALVLQAYVGRSFTEYRVFSFLVNGDHQRVALYFKAICNPCISHRWPANRGRRYIRC